MMAGECRVCSGLEEREARGGGAEEGGVPNRRRLLPPLRVWRE